MAAAFAAFFLAAATPAFCVFDKKDPTPEEMNTAFGKPFFSDTPLWEEDAEAVAARLKWPQESRTNWLSSYRLYPPEDYRILGARPHSAVLYAVNNKPTEISIIFANKGDVFGLGGDAPGEEGRGKRVKQAPNLIELLNDAIKNDKNKISEALTGVLGEVGDKMNFGGSRNTREGAYPWRWRGHGIILAVEEGEYVALRIIKLHVLDQRGRATKSDDPQLRQLLRDSIEHRENGDVILSQVPMVDQGPKGYCVPATYERVLRYVGIPADMYALAMAGNTGIGGGTYIGAIEQGVKSLVTLNGRRFYDIPGRFNLQKVKQIIDEGLPILIGVQVYDKLEMDWKKRMAYRSNPDGWQEHLKRLEELSKERKPDFGPMSGLHMRLVVGYNEKTREIAISDSWGPHFAERWITENEFLATLSGEPKVIRW
jgi:hypothetical protein